MELRAESVSMPGRNLNTTTDSNIYGPTREIVNGAGYGGDVAITFNSDAYLSERILFERWQEMCYGVHNWNAKYYNDYIFHNISRSEGSQVDLKRTYPNITNHIGSIEDIEFLFRTYFL